ncbi:Lipoprotein LpqB, GerMN domain protein [Ammonifex degensii KC4]|uniref:Lipoprotein LpqB, GerMN domain protein n=1 Tax=Ammonifex degensii (strain DSM 10501 / KC4) TaxID=429009 RepID=C9R8F7_AMMDK|nr:GerMN domain-containing protein [Ammonifex degensii]ACX52586.1 Lipoprotein LpqB, GerMN domain protein [Ammonifex degensii KC4]
MRQKLAILSCLLLLGLLAGCFKAGKAPGSSAPAPEEKPKVESPQPPSVEPSRKVTLYFADKEAQYLIPEEREVKIEEQPLERVVVEELLKGPTNSKLCPTIPKGTRLLSLEVKDGIAYVNFSREFKLNHPGGSAAEIMTLYSVVNSLARLGTVDKVQFLLEGQKKESILGHLDTSLPLGPDWSLVKKEGGTR